MMTDNPFAAPESDLRTTNSRSAADIVYATFSQRFAAAFVDGIICNVLGAIVGVALGVAVAATQASPALINTVAPFFGVGIALLYFAVLESSEQQATWGKRLVGLRVTDLDGGQISFGRAAGRFLAKIASYLTLFVGFLMQPFTKRKQALHDILAGTLVVKG